MRLVTGAAYKESNFCSSVHNSEALQLTHVISVKLHGFGPQLFHMQSRNDGNYYLGKWGIILLCLARYSPCSLDWPKTHSSPPASASLSAGIIVMSHHTWLWEFLCMVFSGVQWNNIFQHLCAPTMKHLRDERSVSSLYVTASQICPNICISTVQSQYCLFPVHSHFIFSGKKNMMYKYFLQLPWL